MRRAPPSLARKKKNRRKRPLSDATPSQEGLPQVAIVGRPNVGKSTLFNVWAGRRRAVVSATPGTTRDRISAIVKAPRPDGTETDFVLVDTGGIGIIDDSRITKEVTEQIERGVVEADVIVFLLDVRAGLLPLDHQIAQMLRKTTKPVIVAAAKCETQGLELEASNFQTLGLGDPVPISAEGRKNLDTVRDDGLDDTFIVMSGDLVTPFGAQLIANDTVATNTIVGLDRRFALEEVYETGLMVESDRLIRLRRK